MNMYDTKIIHCSGCGKFIGEIDCDAIVTLPKCGRCTNPLPEVNDCILHPARRVINNKWKNGIFITN